MGRNLSSPFNDTLQTAVGRISAFPDAGLMQFHSKPTSRIQLADAAASKPFSRSTKRSSRSETMAELSDVLSGVLEAVYSLQQDDLSILFSDAIQQTQCNSRIINYYPWAPSRTITLLGTCTRTPTSLNLTRPCTYSFHNTFHMPPSTMYHLSIIVPPALRPTIQHSHLPPFLKPPSAPPLLPD